MIKTKFNKKDWIQFWLLILGIGIAILVVWGGFIWFIVSVLRLVDVDI